MKGKKNIKKQTQTKTIKKLIIIIIITELKCETEPSETLLGSMKRVYQVEIALCIKLD